MNQLSGKKLYVSVLLFLLFSSAVFSCLSSFMHIVLRLFLPSVCDSVSFVLMRVAAYNAMARI